ncbi:Lsr2 dimerization domain-containing protein [Arsenicicoccus sp. UBA7492]
MVQRIHIVLEDDLDGGAAEETVQFSLDGVAYEIDLSTKNAEALRSALRD